jgi:hypothetical protein
MPELEFLRPPFKSRCSDGWSPASRSAKGKGRGLCVSTNLVSEACASLIVCNRPWMPGQPSSPFEHAVHDPKSRMLLGFINGLAADRAENSSTGRGD